ncbi:MAG TPA: hypothetical protein VIM70_06110 [Clostridium sp.]|uniref:hypothetical protein n=1 Tax=Clostridium sp. TaxID=1506 RepID=UPI002F952634
MKIHVIVCFLVIDAFCLGAHIMRGSELGITSALVALVCFGSMYIGESNKKKEIKI